MLRLKPTYCTSTAYSLSESHTVPHNPSPAAARQAPCNPAVALGSPCDSPARWTFHEGRSSDVMMTARLLRYDTNHDNNNSNMIWYNNDNDNTDNNNIDVHGCGLRWLGSPRGSAPPTLRTSVLPRFPPLSEEPRAGLIQFFFLF